MGVLTLKILSLTSGAEAMRILISPLTAYFVDGRHEGRCLVAGPEWSLNACPFPMRSFEEYSLQPEGGPEWLESVARRAILEEKPDLLITAANDKVWDLPGLAELVSEMGVHWHRYAATPNPPQIQVVDRGPARTVKPELGAGVAPLSRAADPIARLRQLVAETGRVRFQEPVNLGFEGGLRRFHYGDYDNEFALSPADLDLRAMLREQLKPEQFRVTLNQGRPGTAGNGPHLEANDGLVQMFDIQVDLAGLPNKSWTATYQAGSQAQLRLLFVDLHNVAGSGMQHALAINRYSRSTAHVLCHEPHPFIEPASSDCNVVYTRPGWTPEIKKLLQDADLIVFWEEDDVDTVGWPLDFQEIARRKPHLHFYVGQRVHKGVTLRQRVGKTVLTGLPHVLRMYPHSKFYHGFYPPVLDSLPLREPLSQSDGVVRVLHTPSLPHASQHRYLYHKDTASFLEAAGVLKERFPAVRFLQVAGVPHHKILQARLDADIIFHQLRGFMGMTGNESMFLRRPTIQATDRENLNRHLELWGLDTKIPWVRADRTNLAECIEKLLVNADYREEVARDSRTFMLQYYSAEVGIKLFLHYALQAVTGSGVVSTDSEVHS
ncbi:hypothetical protein JST97_30460 [bacterium]|nr:hypothetical protein [bacterium]